VYACWAGKGGSGAIFVVLVVGFEVLLHVIGASEFFLAAGKGARDALFCSVDFGVARCVTRGCEGLFAAVGVPVAAGITFSSSIGGRPIVGV
jgi:hypothetical protein